MLRNKNTQLNYCACTSLLGKCRLSLYSIQVTQPATTSTGFLIMKGLGVKLLPPGWDVSPSQGFNPQNFIWGFLMIYHYPFILLPKNTTQWSSQVWNPDLLTQSTVHYPLCHPTPVDNADDGLNQKHSKLRSSKSFSLRLRLSSENDLF